MAISRNVQGVVASHFVGGVEQPHISHLRELAERYDNNPDDVSSQEYNLLVSLKNMEISDNKLAKSLENNSATDRDISRNEERHQKFLERYNQYLENSASKVSLPPLTEQGLKSLLESPTEPKPAQAPPLPPEPTAGVDPLPEPFEPPPLPPEPQVGPVDAPPLPPEVPAKHEAEVAPPIPAMPNELKMAKIEKELDNLANLDTPLPNIEKSASEPDLADPIAALRGTGYERLPERTRVAPSPYGAIPASSADFKSTEMAPGTQPIGAENNYGFMPNSPKPAGENQRPESSAYGKVPENARPANTGYTAVPTSPENARPENAGYTAVPTSPENARPENAGYTAVPASNENSTIKSAYSDMAKISDHFANQTMPVGPEENVQQLKGATNYSPIPAGPKPDANTAEPVGPSPTNDASMTAANEGRASPSQYKTMPKPEPASEAKQAYAELQLQEPPLPGYGNIPQPEPVYAQIQLAAVTEPDADLGPASFTAGYQSTPQAPGYGQIPQPVPAYAELELKDAEPTPTAATPNAPMPGQEGPKPEPSMVEPPIYQTMPAGTMGDNKLPDSSAGYGKVPDNARPANSNYSAVTTTNYTSMPVGPEEVELELKDAGQEGPKPEPSMVEPKDDFDPLTTRAVDAAVEQTLSEQNDLPSFDKLNQAMDDVNLDKKFPVKEIPAQPNFNTVGEMAAQQERLESNKTNEMQMSSTQSPAPKH